MKKIVALLFAAALAVFSASVYAHATETVSDTQMSARYTVTVYWIRNVGSGSGVVTTKKSGTYDSDENTITIDGSTYRVSGNRYYGDGSSRGRYEYVAGGEYYFNL